MMMGAVCGTCGKVAQPIERPREIEQSDGSVRVYGTLCVCACDPRWPGDGLHWTTGSTEQAKGE
jgi:hypothetical protein